MDPIPAPPTSTHNPPPAFHSTRPEHPGRTLLLVWSVLVTLILVIYFLLSLALYLEERNYARRQDQLLEAWRIANPWSPSHPPETEGQQQRDIERSPLVHIDDEDDSDTSEEERGIRHGAGGYGAMDLHPPFRPAAVYADEGGLEYYHGADGVAENPSPPYSPGPLDHSHVTPIEALAEVPDHGHQAADVSTSPSLPFEGDRVDSVGVTASGATWAHLEPNGSYDRAQPAATAEEAGAAATPVNSPADEAPSAMLGGERPSSSSSSSSSSNSPRVLGGHELVTKIKKAVHWPPGTKGSSSSSSSSHSPRSSSRQGETLEGLRKRSSQ
ncbi:hypothetical protein PG993_005947 [Apiospora rasikravindrae]|uniref:Uncharacterized protein n=1 Tax=Apiospora rasikravindrae TaxID=990691 RepID=A0ABR1TA86_9PEZI